MGLKSACSARKEYVQIMIYLLQKLFDDFRSVYSGVVVKYEKLMEDHG